MEDLNLRGIIQGNLPIDKDESLFAELTREIEEKKANPENLLAFAISNAEKLKEEWRRRYKEELDKDGKMIQRKWLRNKGKIDQEINARTIIASKIFQSVKTQNQSEFVTNFTSGLGIEGKNTKITFIIENYREERNNPGYFNSNERIKKEGKINSECYHNFLAFLGLINENELEKLIANETEWWNDTSKSANITIN